VTKEAPLSSDLLVIEFGQRLSASACCSLLAELGATVILIEGFGVAGKGKEPFRASMAAGKKSFLLDESAETVGSLVSLIERADAVVTSSDLDPEWPTPVREAIERAKIRCDVTGFGDGPLSSMAYSDGLMQAVTGVLDLTGDPDGRPTFSGAPILELTTAFYAASGVLLAEEAWLRHQVTGTVKVAMYDSTFSMMTTFLPKYFTGGAPTRIGNRHSSMAPWNTYRASDGWILMCSGSNDHWKRICGLLGQPGLVEDPKFASPAGRVGRWVEVDKIVESWTSKRTAAECIEQFNSVSIPCGTVLELPDVLNNESILHRDMVRTLHDPVTDAEVKVPGAIYRAAAGAGVSAQSIPAIGQDRDDIDRLLRGRDARTGSMTNDVAWGCSGGILAGLRVLEIGQYTTAPLTGRQLGAFGADVIKVEPPGGDPARALPPQRGDQSYFFTLGNSDKRSIVIDFKRAEDKAIFAALLKEADVLVENMKPGTLERFGFGYDEISKINPRVIYCAISGFGVDSPYAHLSAMDTTVQGMSGLMALTNTGGVPFKSGISLCDLVGGQAGLLCILAALNARRRTGKGEFIDISMQDASAWLTRTEWNEVKSVVPRLLRCSDGYVAIESGQDPSGSHSGPAGDASEEAGTRADVVKKLTDQGIVCASVLTLQEAADHPQTKVKRLIVEGKDWPLFASPIRHMECPPDVKRALGPPDFDRDQILADWGLT